MPSRRVVTTGHRVSRSLCGLYLSLNCFISIAQLFHIHHRVSRSLRGVGDSVRLRCTAEQQGGEPLRHTRDVGHGESFQIVCRAGGGAEGERLAIPEWRLPGR